jgi:hypothetical protein
MHRVVEGAKLVTVHVPAESHALLVHGFPSEHGAVAGCGMSVHAPVLASQKL